MKCKIPDERIKKVIQDYRCGNADAFREIINLISPYVYNFPRVIFNQGADICGDFYQSIITNLKSIIAGYRISEVRFGTWFTVVLRNRFVSFIKSRRKILNERGKGDLVYLDDDTGGAPLYVKIPDIRAYVDCEKQNYDSMIEKIVSNLKPGLRVFFHFYFLETVRPEDVVFLSIHLERTPQDIIHALNFLRNSLDEKYRIKNNLYKRLGNVYDRIIESQKRKDKVKVSYYRRVRGRLLEEYFRVKLNPSYNCIGKVLAIPSGTVSTGVFRMKRSIKEIIGEASYERL